MNKIDSIGFAPDPNNVPAFLLDWELTKLCNLDCSYCTTGIEGGHDNTTKHPPLAECLDSIDFMYRYVDLYMQYKKPSQRKVILNVYGGESIFHPDIVEILQACREKYSAYKDKWYLTITCTTNGVVGPNQWHQIVPLVDEFTMSYHAENLPKQKQQYLDNLLYLKEHNKRFKCIIMMHNDPVMFEDSLKVVEFCRENKINFLAKAIDHYDNKFTYTKDQFDHLKTFWIKKEPTARNVDYNSRLDSIGTSCQIQSSTEGRACCGGRKLSLNNDLKSNITFVPAQGFKGWYCSVNWFFLFVQQLTGKVYTNKDCRTSTTGLVEPLGTLPKSDEILDTLKKQLDSSSMPVIQCVKDICLCGICAPKANNIEDFTKLIERNLVANVLK
jgi:hypothetical protein